MRARVCLIRLRYHRDIRAGSDCSPLSLSCGRHGRLATAPGPWWRGAPLLPLRGPPFGSSRRNAELGLGTRYHLPQGASRESRAEKEIQFLCIKITFPLSASSATTYN